MPEELSVKPLQNVQPVPEGKSVHAPVPAVQAPVAPQGGLTAHAAPQQTPLLPQAPDPH
jgi:hypothetical protein